MPIKIPNNIAIAEIIARLVFTIFVLFMSYLLHKERDRLAVTIGQAMA